ncbi:MAG: lamin tail domain-containing protein [Anaerolineales bacterium]
MRSKKWAFLLVFTLLFTSSCFGEILSLSQRSSSEKATQLGEGEPQVLISEVLAGIEGNNNHEFIELYNSSSTTPVEIEGWTLWYQLKEGKDERILHRWTEKAVIPPHGHYLLGRSGESYSEVVDVFFDVSLATSRGGLLLRKPDDTRGDSLSWGVDPQRYGEGEKAPAMSRGVSLERKPGGEDGNALDTGNNREDFQLNSSPEPQGTGSRITPLEEEYLEVSISGPDTVEPGAEFYYIFEVTNHTDQELHDLNGVIPLPEEMQVQDLPGSFSLNGLNAVWEAESLDPGETRSSRISMRAPWTYISTKVANYFVSAANWEVPAFGGAVRTTIAGGSIPAETARTLVGKKVAVEGVATMYTGGYYAGSGNTKFYLEDETGGIQVWVPQGQNKVDVQLGDRVRAQGELQLYRGAVELVVHDLEKVEVLEGSAVELPLEPTTVSIEQASRDESLAGKLVQVEGKVLRSEEFSYSYELDLMGDEAHVLTLYVDKNTEMTLETVEVGDRYQAKGILEVRDSRLQLYPRIQKDLEKVYPPILRLTLEAPNTALSGQTFTVNLTATNHTSEVMKDLEIHVVLPDTARLVEVLDGGEEIRDKELKWEVETLPGNGESAQARFRIQGLDEEYILLEDIQARADQGEYTAEIEPHYVFAGEVIPIWAIQGPGFRSNYVLDEVTTIGVITGLFPELGGFWIQTQEPDSDPRTSEGLFVNAEGLNIDLQPGTEVEVTGVVREMYQQTQIQIESRSDLEVLNTNEAVPVPVELDPPLNNAESETYFESLEGMRVQVVEEALVVAPTNRYGEYTVILPEHRITRLWSAQESGVGITVDDGSYESHDDRTTLDYVVAVGDQVSNITGPLAYTFGNYKIEPTQQPDVIDILQRLPSLPKTGADEFSIATWNVENLFDIRVPHPSDSEMPTVKEYETDIAKVANTIVSAGLPTVVGLQEVENIGILEDVAAHPSLIDYQYQPVLIEGTDSRGIDVGYLVRGDRAEILDTKQFIAPEGLTSRPPLLVRVRVFNEDRDRELYIINNHFTSMSGGEKATEPRRTAQAAWNVSIVEEIREENPQASIAVVGDLNSYYLSPPIDALRDAGLKHVMSTLPDQERYNYIYAGRSQLLDHILVTPNLMDALVRVDVLHTNADFPLPLPGDESPMRKSDHDLVVATFSELE